MIILMYHGILPDYETNPVLSYGKIHRSSFEWQMRWLKRYSTVTSLANVVNALQKGKQLPRRTVVLTFDDGYKNNVDIAYPILEKYQLPATFFVTLDHLRDGQLLWFNELTAKTFVETESPYLSDKWLEHLNGLRRQFLGGILSDNVGSVYGYQVPDRFPKGRFDSTLAGMTQEQLHQIAQSDLIEIGSHTLTHPQLTHCDPARLEKELIISKLELENIAQKKIRFLAYPQGDYNSNVIEKTKQSGYISALAVEPIANLLKPEDNLFCLPRVGIYHDMKLLFIAKCLGFEKLGRIVKSMILPKDRNSS